MDCVFLDRLRPLAEETPEGFRLMNCTFVFKIDEEGVHVVDATAKNPGNGQITHGVVMLRFLADNSDTTLILEGPNFDQPNEWPLKFGFEKRPQGGYRRDPQPVFQPNELTWIREREKIVKQALWQDGSAESIIKNIFIGYLLYLVLWMGLFVFVLIGGSILGSFGVSFEPGTKYVVQDALFRILGLGILVVPAYHIFKKLRSARRTKLS